MTTPITDADEQGLPQWGHHLRCRRWNAKMRQLADAGLALDYHAGGLVRIPRERTRLPEDEPRVVPLGKS
jgi:hypothetical protein